MLCQQFLEMQLFFSDIMLSYVMVINLWLLTHSMCLTSVGYASEIVQSFI